MSNIGDVIVKHRKIKGMTQKELAEKMHVSPQAVSKWELNLSEPDLSAIKELALIFDISVDELFSLEKVTKETIIKEEVVINKYMCDICKELYTKEDLREIGVNTTCNSCYKEREKKRTYMLEKDMLKNKGLKPFITGGIIGLITLVVLFIIFITTGNESFGNSIGAAITYGLIVMLISTQMLYESPLKEVFFFFVGRTVRMPGIIFDLSIDGLILLIIVKVFLGLLSVLISLFIFAIGLIVTIVVSPFTYVIDLLRAIKFSSEGIKV